jgi:penicillin-binding protein 2
MVSVPSFDNNLWTKGAPTIAEYKVLSDTLHKPLLNHATFEAPPPGSTFKIISAIALLEEGYVTPETIINDPGVFKLPDSNDQRDFYCWIGLRGGNHGNQRVNDALRNSCNTFFRKAVGGYAPENIPGMGEDLLAKWGRIFGIGEPNDVKLAYVTGDVPTENDIARRLGRPWFQGDSFNAAIGQGYVGATVLEMANVIASIGNGGTLYQPQIIKEIHDPSGNVIQPFEPKVIRQLPVRPEYLALVRQSLRDVVSIEKGGTALESSLEPFGFEYSGKTGTAEFCDDVAFKTGICYDGIKVQPTHAWFVAYAPSENPTLALAIYVWNGGQGSGVAAPVAQRIINDYFKLGVPEDKLKKVTKDQDSQE